jgi:hypothetical protein
MLPAIRSSTATANRAIIDNTKNPRDSPTQGSFCGSGRVYMDIWVDPR